jgi:uncharacterized DUF497 family protein
LYVRFEWDPQKAASNAAKHCVTFEEVISARFASRVERALFHEYMRSIP